MIKTLLVASLSSLSLLLPSHNHVVGAGDAIVTYKPEPSKMVLMKDTPLTNVELAVAVPIPQAVTYTAPTVTSYSGGLANTYTFGNCTWYVASQLSVPQDLGNANTWAARAQAEGFRVSSIPAVGSVAQTSAGGLGHVALVIAISGNQVEVSEMNALAGFDAIDQRWSAISDWVYIYF